MHDGEGAPASSAAASSAAAAGGRSRPRLRSALALAAGLVLLGAFAWALLALPRGPSEFAYAPDLFTPLPFASMRGFTVEQLASHALRLALLLPAILLLASGLTPHVRLRPPSGEALRRLSRTGTAAALLLATALLASLSGRALTADELTYEMQAELLLQGRVFEDRYPRWGHEAFTIWTPRGATGKYPPGEPLVQAVGAAVGAPALAHLPLAAAGLLAWFAAVRRRAGPEVGAWATLLVAWSPMFLLTTPTGLSHATSLALAGMAALGYEWLRAEKPAAGGALLGGALGFLLLVRPQVALALGIVLGTSSAWHLARRRQIGGLALLAFGCAFGIVTLASYNSMVTGSPSTLPWSLFHPAEHYGFGTPIEGSAHLHGMREAFENFAVSAVRFNAWWLGWPLSLALLALPGATGRDRGGLGPWGWAGVSLVAVNFPYYSPGISDTGPIYYYELMLPASLAGALALRTALARWGERAMLLLAIATAFGTGSFLLEHTVRLRRLVDVVHAPAEAVLALIEPPALLLYETSPQEALHPGWMFSFPIRERRPDAAILTFPRGTPTQAAALRRALPGRSCWYYRLEPPAMIPRLHRCEEAEALLRRPRPLPGPPRFVPSTARRLGLIDR